MKYAVLNSQIIWDNVLAPFCAPHWLENEFRILNCFFRKICISMRFFWLSMECELISKVEYFFILHSLWCIVEWWFNGGIFFN